MRTMKQALKALLALSGKRQEDVAAEVKIARENLNRTINKPDHRIQADLLPIAQACGFTIRVQFVDLDGDIAATVDYPQK